jgi:tRNA U34 5-methylaminomethyl-2-thiouridine-forming methyltransferase MnmC
MKQVITDDSSPTFYSEKYTEHYHSLSGGVEESIKKYAEPCNIKDFDEVDILDVCFGIGYNSAAALDAFNGKKITIVALENDPEIINKIQDINPEFKNFDIIKNAAKNLEYEGKYDNETGKSKVSIKIIMGDARETIKQLNVKFDCIFFDPFSPKKCPELWTKEFFEDVVKVMKKGAILATYSYARIVRDNLKSVGLEVSDGPIVGRRSPSTLAKKL